MRLFIISFIDQTTCGTTNSSCNNISSSMPGLIFFIMGAIVAVFACIIVLMRSLLMLQQPVKRAYNHTTLPISYANSNTITTTPMYNNNDQPSSSYNTPTKDTRFTYPASSTPLK